MLRSNRIFNIILLLSFAVLFVSCQRDQAFALQEKVMLMPDKTLKIELDSLTSYQTDMMTLVDDTLLAYENRSSNCIQFYDINRGQLASKICLDVKGDHSTGYLSGFYIQSMDSIYVNGDHTREVTLVNDEAKVINRFPLSHHDFGTPVGGTFFPIEKIGDTLYFACLPGYNLYTVSSVGQVMEIAYDLTTQQHTEHFFFPEDYEGFHNTYYVTYSRIINDKGEFVYSFPMCHDLYIKKANGEVYKQPAPSRYAKGVDIRRNTEFADDLDELKASIEGYAYRYIIYDSYREVYYRFFRHPMEYLDPATGLPRSQKNDSPYSIIILDKNFEWLGEYLLPEYTFNADVYCGYFLNSEGLWIANNHPENPELEEDYLSFTLHKLTFLQENVNQ